MNSEVLNRLRQEVDAWRARLDELRVQASLGRMELRDKKEELARNFEEARSSAARKLAELRKTGGQEIDAVARSIEVAWEGLRKTHGELSPLGKGKSKEKGKGE